MLSNLEQHGVQDEARGGGHVEGLLRLDQPVDAHLQGGLEGCCQGNHLLQPQLWTVERNEGRDSMWLSSASSVSHGSLHYIKWKVNSSFGN